jgi:DNA-binding MarR family transcriptional regulator
MGIKWDENELATLYEMAEMYTPKQIASRLKRRGYTRTELAIINKLNALGYSSRPVLDNYSCREIAKNLCVPPSTVVNWVRQGWLKAKKRCVNRYQVKSRDLKRIRRLFGIWWGN